MNITAFFRGMCLGLIAGVAADMICSGKQCRKTKVGRVMQRMENAVDGAIKGFTA